jgi:ribosomal protein S4E
MPKQATKAVEAPDVFDGDYCEVTGGTHKGKSGLVQDRNVSKSGHVTITVKQDSGDRFKTLALNVVVTRRAKRK